MSKEVNGYSGNSFIYFLFITVLFLLIFYFLLQLIYQAGLFIFLVPWLFAYLLWRRCLKSMLVFPGCTCLNLNMGIIPSDLGGN